MKIITNAERKFENTGLNTIVEDVKTELKETIEEKHATIEAPELCQVNISLFQFRQLMHILISNALKFSKNGIPPHIIIKSKIEKGSKLNSEKNVLQAGIISPEKTTALYLLPVTVLVSTRNIKTRYSKCSGTCNI